MDKNDFEIENEKMEIIEYVKTHKNFMLDDLYCYLIDNNMMSMNSSDVDNYVKRVLNTIN